MDTVGLEQTTVAGTDFFRDMAFPPIAGETVTSSFDRIDGDVIRTFQFDDMIGFSENTGITPAMVVLEKLETHFGAGVMECIEIPDFGLDGREV